MRMIYGRTANALISESTTLLAVNKLHEELNNYNSDSIELELLSVSAPDCKESNNYGTVTIKASGGNPLADGVSGQYQYQFNNENLISYTIFGSSEITFSDSLTPGTWTVVVFDQPDRDLCSSDTLTFIVPKEIGLAIQISVASCDYHVKTYAFGGNPMSDGIDGQYTYYFCDEDLNCDTVVGGSEIEYRRDFESKIWSVSVSDQPDVNDCTSYELRFDFQDSISLQFTELTSKCQNGLADIVMEVTPEVIAFATISIRDSNGDPFPLVDSIFETSGDTILGIPPGTYFIYYRDGDGCEVSDSFTVSEFKDFSLGVPISTGPDCGGPGDNGMIEIVIEEGEGPFIYSWSDGSTDNPRTGLIAGDYEYTVTDASGCERMGDITLSNQFRAAFPSYTIIKASCETCEDGGIIFDDPDDRFTFAWPGGLVLDQRNDLAKGIYLIGASVDSLKDCVKDSLFTIGYNKLILNTITNNPNCIGNSNGSIEVSVEDGIPPYTYIWNDGSTDSMRTNLEVGSYSVTVSDQENNQNTRSITLTGDPSNILEDITIFSMDVSCGGNNDGLVIFDNPDDVFTFTWQDSLKIAERNDVSAGEYLVGVSIDSLPGCVTDTTVVVSNSFENTVQIDFETIENIQDYTDTLIATVSGGTGPYSYFWSDSTGSISDTLFNIQPGTYFVSVSDINSCMNLRSITIEPKIVERSIYIPNIFRNDANVVHDSNRTYGIYVDREVTEVLKLNIFDRWGSLVYELENVQVQNSRDKIGNWDGTLDNTYVESSTFVVIVELLYPDDEIVIEKGDFVYIR